MATGDFSRSAYDKRKHYSSVRMQQGRVQTDYDWNENEQIENEDRRRARVDIIGPYGTPDQGFLITEPNGITINGNSLIDFNIHPGTFYLGGIRLEFERNLISSITIENLDDVNDLNVVNTLNGEPDARFTFVDPPIITKKNDSEWLIINEINDRAYFVNKGAGSLNIYEQETYRTQKNWLQQSNDLPLLPDLTNDDKRIDLVYLEVWQQPVSAVEDSELFEIALGGCDTSVMMRTMWRVKLEPGIGSSDCAGAWQEQIDKWSEGNEGQISEENERVPDVRLSVSFTEDGSSDDLCKPSVGGGYLGAENQAIRVQLVDGTHFTWGFDNASQLYRVQVNGGAIELLTDPKDQAHWPIAGRIVEILPWSAVLPNSEKIAGISGYLSRVDSYDPDTGKLILTESLPPEFGDEWESRSDEEELKNPSKYFFLRIWNRGSDTMSDPEIEFDQGIAESLGNTGLEVTITGNDRVPGDYWIIAARPETPNRVVPWAFESDVGLPPHGVRRFFAPLALIQWTSNNNGEIVGEMLSDCRKTFPSLTQLQSCCTFMVGDGIRSHGDFNSIEEAVRNLPASGGEICLLPGVHEANVEIENKHDIKIKGCGKKTMVIPGRSNRKLPVFSVIDSQCITLENMNIVTIGGTSIILTGSEIGKLREIEIHNNRIIACENGISVSRGEGIVIHHNKIRMLDKEKGGVAIFIMAEDSMIERNDISVILSGNIPPITRPDGEIVDPDEPCLNPEIIYGYTLILFEYVGLVWELVITSNFPEPYKALGGIQILGGSERMKVLENKITGGAGNGIALGGILPVNSEEEEGVNSIVESSDRNDLSGYVRLEGGDAISGQDLYFTNTNINTGKTYHFTTASDGHFLGLNSNPGKYEVLIPGYKITKILEIPLSDDEVFRRERYNIVVEENNVDLFPAFLYDIQIDRNEISYMGLSGIGIPRPITKISTDTLAPSFNPLVRLGNPVVGISIHSNKIFQCLQILFDNEMMSESKIMGRGGISLGICENLSIYENRIEKNGVNHLYPVCGIFVNQGERVEILHNHITNNGSLKGISSKENGIRGGIVMNVSSFSISELTSISQTAARIHDNVVDQPIGQALQIRALGPVSILNNCFSSELSGTEIMDLFAGAVLIINLGSIYNPEHSDFTHLSQVNMRPPNGSILFNNNQTRIGFKNSSLNSQIIITNDDIGFNGNQSECLSIGSTRKNTSLYGVTVRASDNRFKEVFTNNEVAMSLFTFTVLMNNTVNNQGDHCIIALNANPITNMLNNTGNQVLVTGDLCGGLREGLKRFSEINTDKVKGVFK